VVVLHSLLQHVWNYEYYKSGCRSQIIK